jgi:hypothetical protein
MVEVEVVSGRPSGKAASNVYNALKDCGICITCDPQPYANSDRVSPYFFFPVPLGLQGGITKESRVPAFLEA